MILVIRLAAALFLLWGPLRADPVNLDIRMLNGDRFSGGFLRFDQGYFHLRPDWGGNPVRFHAAHTGHVRVRGVSDGDLQNAGMRVTFVNGDRVSGNLLEMNDRELRLAPLWGGVLRADRSFVDSLEMLPGEEDRLFRGLSPVRDWTMAIPAGYAALEEDIRPWTLHENVRISRALPLPDSGGVLFELELSFPAGFMNATLDLFHSTVRRHPREGLSLSLNPSWVHVRTLDREGRHIWVLREPLPPAPPDGRIKMVFYLSLDTGEVTLRVNGESYPPFAMHFEKPLAGREDLQVALHAGRESGGLQIHDVAFTRYRGIFAPPSDSRNPARDEVLFINGDRMEARAVSNRAETLVLQMEDGQEIEVPRSRIRLIRLASSASAHPRRRDRDVQVNLMERGDRLTLALKEFRADSVSGRSDLWLDIPQIPLSHIDSVRLNVYQALRHDQGEIQIPMFMFEH